MLDSKPTGMQSKATISKGNEIDDPLTLAEAVRTALNVPA
jgi:hypothetical protein